MAAGQDRVDTAGLAGERRLLLDDLARRYRQSLVRFFERRAARDDVPDLVQDVFLRLARLGDVSGIQKPEQYLFTTAASALRDHARRRATRCAGLHDSYVDEVHGRTAVLPPAVEARDVMASLEVALRTLPVRTRDVFVLRVMDGQRMADISRMLGISVRAAEKHQARALAHVARVLGSWDDD